MENRGVLLYVDLGRLEDEPYRLSKIYDTLGQYIDDIRRQRDIIYISKMRNPWIYHPWTDIVLNW